MKKTLPTFEDLTSAMIGAPNVHIVMSRALRNLFELSPSEKEVLALLYRICKKDAVPFFAGNGWISRELCLSYSFVSSVLTRLRKFGLIHIEAIRRKDEWGNYVCKRWLYKTQLGKLIYENKIALVGGVLPTIADKIAERKRSFKEKEVAAVDAVIQELVLEKKALIITSREAPQPEPDGEDWEEDAEEISSVEILPAEPEPRTPVLNRRIDSRRTPAPVEPYTEAELERIDQYVDLWNRMSQRYRSGEWEAELKKPSIHKIDLAKPKKTIKNICRYIDQLEKGTFQRINGLKDTVKGRFPIGKKFTMSEIKTGIRNYLQAFQPGKTLYKGMKKNALTPSMETFLFNYASGYSFFILSASASPKTMSEHVLDSVDPDMLERYKLLFHDNPNYLKNRLPDIKRRVQENKKWMEMVVEDVGAYMNLTVEKLTGFHIEFLNTLDWLKEKMSAGNIAVRSKHQFQFEEWLYETHKIKLCMSASEKRERSWDVFRDRVEADGESLDQYVGQKRIREIPDADWEKAVTGAYQNEQLALSDIPKKETTKERKFSALRALLKADPERILIDLFRWNAWEDPEIVELCKKYHKADYLLNPKGIVQPKFQDLERLLMSDPWIVWLKDDAVKSQLLLYLYK